MLMRRDAFKALRHAWLGSWGVQGDKVREIHVGLIRVGAHRRETVTMKTSERQHPGTSMPAWWPKTLRYRVIYSEGVDTLIDETSPRAAALRILTERTWTDGSFVHLTVMDPFGNSSRFRALVKGSVYDLAQVPASL